MYHIQHDGLHICSAVHGRQWGQTDLTNKERKVAWKNRENLAVPSTRNTSQQLQRLKVVLTALVGKYAKCIVVGWLIKNHQMIVHNLQFSKSAWWVKNVKTHPPPSPAGKADQNWSLGPRRVTNVVWSGGLSEATCQWWVPQGVCGLEG